MPDMVTVIFELTLNTLSVPPLSTVVEIAPAPTIDMSLPIVIAPSASAYVLNGTTMVAPERVFAELTA